MQKKIITVNFKILTTYFFIHTHVYILQKKLYENLEKLEMLKYIIPNDGNIFQSIT